MRACFKLSELVGAPACGGSKRRVIIGGPESCAFLGCDLGSLILGLVNKGKSLHVVCCEIGESAVFLGECKCLIKADNDSVFVIDGVDTDGVPFYVAGGVLDINACILSIVAADFEISSVVFPKRLTGESVLCSAGCPCSCGIVNGFILDGDPLRACVALGVNITFCAVEAVCIDVNCLAGCDCIGVGCIAEAGDRFIGSFLVLEEVNLGVLDLESIVEGVCSEVHESGVELLLH